jgi:cardiolipin synthase
VRVRLILQGQPDMQIVKTMAGTLHALLLRAGVEIHEYCKRPLHGKVALVDDQWATVGSSNLDPLSLSLNLEANVITRDPGFVAGLRDNLEHLTRLHCTQVEEEVVIRERRWYAWLDALAYHLTRHFPAWAGWLPAHRPQLSHWRPASQAANDSQAEPAPEHGDDSAHATPRTAR